MLWNPFHMSLATVCILFNATKQLLWTWKIKMDARMENNQWVCIDSAWIKMHWIIDDDAMHLCTLSQGDETSC